MTGNSSSASPLLHCLSQLNDDVWAEVLLPKLIAQGTAADVALTCSQLRRLCQHSIRQLNLKQFPASSLSAAVVTMHAAAMAEHFPNCKIVQMQAEDDTSYWQLPLVLPLLGRLPNLQSVWLHVGGGSGPLPTAMLLGSLRTALTGMQDLTLKVTQDWSAGSFCWAQVAEMSHLTALDLGFMKDDVKEPYKCKDVAVLGQLTSLQKLVLHSTFASGLDVPSSHNVTQQQLAAVYSWLGALSALTQLELSLATASGFSSIRSCTKLCSLKLRSVTNRGVVLGPQEWDAIGQLTRLTTLYTGNGIRGTQTAACMAAVENLKGLVYVGAREWSADAVQVFCELPHLATIKGGWEVGTQQQANIELGSVVSVCSHVTCLEEIWGPVPFQSFPNLRKVVQSSQIDLSNFLDLSQHCTQLEELRVQASQTAYSEDYTLDDVCELADRISAILALSQLVNLTVLGFKPSANVELAALAIAAERLAGLHNLRHIGVVFESGSSASAVGLVPLVRLPYLEKLEIAFCDPDYAPDDDYEDHFVTLLTAARRVRSVDFAAGTQQLADCLQDVRQYLQRTGLPMPQELRIQIMQGGT